MRPLRADTQIIVIVGPFIDVNDGKTPETAVTLGAMDECELLKHNSATVVDISGATWAAVTNCDGYYALTLTTSHTDTEGFLTLAFNDDSVFLPVKAEFVVMNAVAYDALYAAAETDYLQVDTVQVSGTSQTANDNGADINAILTDTNELQGDITDGGRIDLLIDAILADTAELQGLISSSKLPAQIQGIDSSVDLSSTMKTSVNSEVIDVMATDTVAEFGQGAPPASPSMKQILNYLYRAWRNKVTQTSSERGVYDDAGTTKLVKASTSYDGTTFTKNEYESGA